MKKILFLFLLCASCLNAALSPALLAAAKRRNAVGTATFSDNFSRADSNPLSLTSSSGGTWQTGVDSTGSFRIQTFKSNGVGASDKTLRVAAPTFTGQHYAQVTAETFSGAFYGPCVRVQSSSLFNGYMLQVNGSNTALIISKLTDSAGSISGSTLGAAITVSAMSAGDVIKLDVSGTSTVTLNAYVNGSLVATRTDSTSPYTGGQPGVYSFNTTGQISAYAAADF